MNLLRVITVSILSSLTFGCIYLTNPYKSIDNEFLRYVGQGKVGAAYDVRVQDGFAYVTNNDGVVIFDVSQPENLKKIGKIDIGTSSFGIDIEKNSIYIAGGNRLIIADITHPENPEILGDTNLNSVLSKVRIKGNFAYIASREKGLQIVDVSNPKNPEKIGIFNNGGAGQAVEIADNVVYYADSKDGLEIIDVSDPAAPRLVTTVPETVGAFDIFIDTAKEFPELYIGCHGNGIFIVRIGSDGKYHILGHFDDGGESLGVWFDNNNLFVADNFEFEILNVSEPLKPKKIIEINNLNGLHDLFVEGKYIYLADGAKGLIILEYKAQ
ncbi:MAG: hypothetical protein OEZ52_11995 [Candidatus Aminicenantes bacterium]|nr:hypothetical protein [Candidatus Aminicenantes bacterium]